MSTTPRRTPVDVAGDLARVVHEVTGLPVAEVRPDRLLVDDLRIDSLAMVEVLERAAQHFGVRIDDEDTRRFVRVRDLAAYVEDRLAAGR